MRKHRKKLWMYVIVALLIGWPLIRIIGMLSHSEPQEKPEKLLYQVSLYQMELLGSYLTESSKAGDTEALNALRQSVYSAQFAHDHLTMAYGESRLAKLDSLSQLLQYLIRLQIGGGRPLRPDELQLFADINKQFGELFDAYGKLLSSGGEIVGSQAARLSKADKAISELLKKKLLR